MCFGKYLCCSIGQCIPDSVRLADNTTTVNYVGGRVEICLSNSWRAFRYDHFTVQNGHVVCQELYPGSHAVSVIPSRCVCVCVCVCVVCVCVCACVCMCVCMCV